MAEEREVKSLYITINVLLGEQRFLREEYLLRPHEETARRLEAIDKLLKEYS